MNEASVNYELICSICDRSFASVNDLTDLNYTLSENIDDIQVKCLNCKQIALKKCNTHDILNKTSSKVDILNLSSDIKCLSNDSSDQLHQSSGILFIESWRSIFSELITRNQRLNEKVDQLEKQFYQHVNNSNDRLHKDHVQIKELRNENQQLKKQFDEQMIWCNEFQNDNRVLKEQIVQLEQQNQQQCQSHLEQLKNSNSQLNSYLTKLNDQSKKNEELEIELKQLKEQIIECKININEIDIDNKRQKLTINQLADDYDQLKIEPKYLSNRAESISNIDKKTRSKTIVSVAQPDINSMDDATNDELNDSQRVMNETQYYEKESEIIYDQNSRIQQKIQQCAYHSTLDLRKHELTDQHMEIIVTEGLINKKIKNLRLESNKITSIGAWILADTLSNNKALEQLSLSDNEISDDGVYSLAKALSINNTLQKLNLGNNKITDEGAKHLTEMIKTNRTLTHLYIQKNDITDEGIQIFVNALKEYNSTLEELSFYSNKSLTDLSVDSLVQMISNHRTLKKLYVFDCNLSEIGKTRLLKAQLLNKQITLYINSLSS